MVIGPIEIPSETHAAAANTGLLSLRQQLVRCLAVRERYSHLRLRDPYWRSSISITPF